MTTDENGCYTLPNGDCVSEGPCIHTPLKDIDLLTGEISAVLDERPDGAPWSESADELIDKVRMLLEDHDLVVVPRDIESAGETFKAFIDVAHPSQTIDRIRYLLLVGEQVDTVTKSLEYRHPDLGVSELRKGWKDPDAGHERICQVVRRRARRLGHDEPTCDCLPTFVLCPHGFVASCEVCHPRSRKENS